MTLPNSTCESYRFAVLKVVGDVDDRLANEPIRPLIKAPEEGR